MSIIKQEERRDVYGVPGRAHNVVTWHGNGNKNAPNEIANQKWTSDPRPVDQDYWGRGAKMSVELRFDDQCKNGHKTFAITAEIYRPGARDVEACGCLHDEIQRYFPEFAPLTAWHSVSDSGPLHYAANTCYHASDRDYNGLRKGETKQLVNGKSKLPVWECVVIGPDGEEVPRVPSWVDAETVPENNYKLEWRPRLIIGEGKERDLDAARRSANWPDAPEKLLTGPREELETALAARLPQLLSDFQAAMGSCGFIEKETV